MKVSGKLIGGVIVIGAILAGIFMYYLQVYAFYDRVVANGQTDVQLTTIVGGAPETILYEDFSAIDSESSPIRYRACFTTPMSLALLTETYVAHDAGDPRNGPDWFDCYDAAALASEIEAGTALVFLGQKNVRYGVDRLVAITGDGRGYIWHELNNCGERAYDGSPVGEECPPRQEVN